MQLVIKVSLSPFISTLGPTDPTCGGKLAKKAGKKVMPFWTNMYVSAIVRRYLTEMTMHRDLLKKIRLLWHNSRLYVGFCYCRDNCVLVRGQAGRLQVSHVYHCGSPGDTGRLTLTGFDRSPNDAKRIVGSAHLILCRNTHSDFPEMTTWINGQIWRYMLLCIMKFSILISIIT